jgi:tRNA pseudouridine38-40 synthase
MNITYEMLDPEIGLKFNDQVFLGRENVMNFIRSHQDFFHNLDLKPIEDSQMLYGYDEAGNPVKLGFNGKKIQRIITLKKKDGLRRFKVTMNYDGSRYAGFQIQKNQLTIQGELTRVVSSINGVDTLVQGVSRTDAGVHALQYVFHFDASNDLTSERWMKLLNYQLPKDMHINSVQIVHPLFHSRYDVYKKQYLYCVRLNERNPFRINYEWQIEDLNLDILKNQVNQIIGTHDFSSFCKGNPDSTTRTIFNVELFQKGNELNIVFEGDGFLRYMIRILVYTLVEIARGNLDIQISDIIKEKSRKHTKHMAPASGLYLKQIIY